MLVYAYKSSGMVMEGLRDPGEKLLSAQDLADYLGIPMATLYRWRHLSQGPPGFRVGRHIRYRWREVEDWVEDQIPRKKT